ncbi:MAG TPA: efflux RND transporter periplasmic adaptor subunit [Puia sp.]|nr:efflux RND transporter periplasmic adaptor subunit [Puia sp.]
MNSAASTLFLISCLGILSCQHKQATPPPPTPVNLDTVKDAQVWYYEKYPATTQALSQVDLHAQVQGYITGIFFEEGSFVTKGQKLYEIDRRLYQQAYDAAAANLKVAQGNFVQAKQDADRYVYLNNHNAVAKQQLDHAVIAQQNADNEVKAAEEQLKTAETNLAYSIIHAPFDGLIGFSQVKLGNLVTVGSTVLNTISTINPMAVDFLINEKQLTHYEDLADEHKHHPDSLFTLLLPNGSLYPFLGKISVIDRAVDPQTGALRIRLVFPNPKYALKAGMSCVVREHNQDTGPQIVVPGRAVVEQMGEYFVFLAKDSTVGSPDSASTRSSTPKLRAFQVKVQPGQTIGGDVVIRSGLKPGDVIVVDGVQALHEGSGINASKAQSGKTDSTAGKPGERQPHH